MGGGSNMYKRNAQGWSKHMDFFLLDELSLQIAFLIATAIRHHEWAFNSSLYRSLAFMLILIDAFILAYNNSMHDVIHRGYYAEAVETLKHCFYVFAIATIFMFATKSGDAYSRIILFLTFFFHGLIGYGMRVLWKAVIKRRGLVRKKKNNMLVVTTLENAENILNRLNEDELASYKITGVVLVDDTDKDTIAGYPVVTNIDGAADYIVKKWIDSVYIDAPLSNEKVVQLMNDCTTMAVPTHYHVRGMSRNEAKNFPEKIGGTTVLTTSINYVTPAQMLIKRCFDIVAGLFGSLVALVIIAVVGPIIKKQSPGPILFTQERIGQNGKPFKMYKIRSMYMDAEERKKDLMDQNRVKDGMMFKLDFDPRIIGNEILPDGTRKTGIGEFIRKTSLDEFPQFFCVLKGDMSTIGTRPPLPSEYSLYKYHHRARIAIKPGITGMWQVNGRSDITDFEEVVRLDKEYIRNWSIGLDLRILFKTVGVLFSKKGAM
jgi:exopolysaccharide biosynthesis polyprenyl glycosylphosphotransferase